MNRRLLICVVHSLIFHVTVCQTRRNIGYCMPPDSIDIICCIGFYNSGDNCIECEPGYIGVNCSTFCPAGYFGRRCSERCQCSSDMYCEHIRGCLCNTTSANCTQSEQDMTTASIFSTVYQPNQIADNRTKFLLLGILPFAVPVVVCFAIGMVCIRQAKIQEKTVHNMTDCSAIAHGSATEDIASSEAYNHLNLRMPSSSRSTFPKDKAIAFRELLPSPQLNTDVPFPDNRKDIHVNQHSLPTACERNSNDLDDYFIMTHNTKRHDKTSHQQEERNLASRKEDTEQLLYINSIEGQQKNGGEIVKFEFPEPIQGTAVFEEKSKKENLSSTVSTFDEEFYANSCDTMYSNSRFLSDNQTDSEDTEVIFDFKYKGQLTNNESVCSSCSSNASKDMFDYMNCGDFI